MILTKQFIQQVKEKTDIVELVGRYAPLQKAGEGVYSAECPNPEHKDDTPSFRVFEKDQSWCCYGCHYGNKANGKTHADTNYGSDCIAFMQWITGGRMSWKDAVIYLAKEAGLSIPNDVYEKTYKMNAELALKYHHNLNDEARNYLYSRGLSDEDIKTHLLGYDGVKIVFPLIDINDRVIGFTTRWIVLPPNCKDKYRNSKASEVFNKSTYLYGLNQIDKAYPYVFITEGPMDRILSSKYGLKNVLSTLGTSFTDGHAEIIKNLGLIPVFILDGDDAGLKATRKAIEKMNQLEVSCKILPLCENVDLADLALIYKQNLVEYIETNMITYGYFVTDQIIKEYIQELLKLKDKTKPKLMKAIMCAPSGERGTLMDMIQETTNITLREDIK